MMRTLENGQSLSLQKINSGKAFSIMSSCKASFRMVLKEVEQCLLHVFIEFFV